MSRSAVELLEAAMMNMIHVYILNAKRPTRNAPLLSKKGIAAISRSAIEILEAAMTKSIFD